MYTDYNTENTETYTCYIDYAYTYSFLLCIFFHRHDYLYGRHKRVLDKIIIIIMV